MDYQICVNYEFKFILCETVMAEINLLKSIPKIKRNIKLRVNEDKDKYVEIASKFGKDYFDGDRKYGYGGYYYDGRWVTVAKDIISHFKLKKGDKVLDVGCGKGFLVKDLLSFGIDAYGVDISNYALMKCEPEVLGRLHLGSCDNLFFPDNSFAAVVSINTIHNLDKKGCLQSIKEIERLAPGKGFIQVDSFKNERQKKIFENWVLTAKFYDYPNNWINLFNKAKYTGDWSWTIMEE